MTRGTEVRMGWMWPMEIIQAGGSALNPMYFELCCLEDFPGALWGPVAEGVEGC